MAKPILPPLEFRDKEGELVDLNDYPLLHKALMHTGQLWIKHNKKFMNAMDDSQRKTIQVNFAVLLNTKETAPVVDTTISFRDKCKEGGMDVIKTHRDSIADELDNPDAPVLPGVDMNAAKAGRLANEKEPINGEGQTTGDGETAAGTKRRGRPKKKL